MYRRLVQLLGNISVNRKLCLGFGLVLVLFSAMRERLDSAPVPAAWRGAPIALATAGLMSLAFMGFAGMAPA